MFGRFCTSLRSKVKELREYKLQNLRSAFFRAFTNVDVVDNDYIIIQERIELLNDRILFDVVGMKHVSTITKATIHRYRSFFP
jgi:hypothetical protein